MSDDVLVMEREMPAPPERVFEALTRPELVVRWWGGLPAEAGDVRAEVDLRAGGRWRFPMSFGGSTCWVGGTYLEVLPPTRLRFDFAWETDEGAPTPVTITLRPLPDGRTLLRLEHELGLRRNACVEGWDAQFGPLARLLAAA